MKVTIELECTADNNNAYQQRLDDLIIGVLPDIQSAWERNAEGSGFIYDDDGSPLGRWTTTEKKS